MVGKRHRKETRIIRIRAFLSQLVHGQLGRVPQDWNTGGRLHDRKEGRCLAEREREAAVKTKRTG